MTTTATDQTRFRARARGRVLVIGHVSTLIAQSLAIALERAGVPATAVCDNDELNLDDADTIVVCDAAAAQRVSMLAGARAWRRDAVRVIALDDACALDADVHLPSTATTDDLVMLLEEGVARPSLENRSLQPRQRWGSRTGGLERLTTRETQVITLLVAGATNDRIADELGVSPNTARTHVQNVLTKLGAHSRLEAAGTAAAHDDLLAHAGAALSREVRHARR